MGAGYNGKNVKDPKTVTATVCRVPKWYLGRRVPVGQAIGKPARNQVHLRGPRRDERNHERYREVPF